MKPMLATRGDHVPTGPAWVHEVKWDGIRALVDVTGGRLRIYSRGGNDITVGFPELGSLVEQGRDLLLDGEIVAMSSGVPVFAAVAPRLHTNSVKIAARLATAEPATLLIFDLLRLDGVDLTGRPLTERRELLAELDLDGVAWQVTPTYDDGQVLEEAVKAQGLEGIVSKRRASLYRSDSRSKDWLKFPIRRRDTFLVGGYRYETDSESRLGAVLVGETTPHGLVFRGRVGSGLAGKAGQRLLELLLPIGRAESPFHVQLLREDVDGTVWVEPHVMVDVEYLEQTSDGRLRHPAYVGVRSQQDLS